jgi:hypothetical protein
MLVSGSVDTLADRMSRVLGRKVVMSREPYFFIHVMRTGGASLARQLETEFPGAQTYPDRLQDLDEVRAHLDIDWLLNLPRERTAAIRFYSGHFPYFVTEMLPCDVTAFTILRDPVDRTISLLKSKQLGARRTLPLATFDTDEHVGVDLEVLYDNADLRATMLDNFQTRQFAITRDDGLAAGVDPLVCDESRLELAKSNLAKVDAIGIFERYDEFLETLRARFGFKSHSGVSWHVSEPAAVSDEFRARIAADNAVDYAFYRYAVELYDARRATDAEHSLDRR